MEAEAVVDDHTQVAGMAPGVLTIMPNPVRDIVWVRTRTTIVRADLFDAEGRAVCTMHPQADGSISVVHLAPGVYRMRVLSQDGKVAAARFVRLP
jgi:hypothetical protein